MLIMGFHYSYLDLGFGFFVPQRAWDSSQDMKWRCSELQNAKDREKEN